MLSAADRAYLDHIQAELEGLIRDAAASSAFVETKPYQRVLHVAALAETDPDKAAALLEQALALPRHGRSVTPGNNVVEFSATDITKGAWLAAEKTRYATTVFAGDDVTDETALGVLDSSNDIGIKVQPAAATTETAANYQLNSVESVATFLTELAVARQAAQ